MKTGDADALEEVLTRILGGTISVFDPAGEKKEKEKYYQAFLTGLLTGNGEWGVISNKESGEGFPDIMVELEDPDKALVIEIKSADTFASLDKSSSEAMEQILSRRYWEYLTLEGRDDIWGWGIAFYKKRCRATARKLE